MFSCVTCLCLFSCLTLPPSSICKQWWDWNPRMFPLRSGWRWRAPVQRPVSLTLLHFLWTQPKSDFRYLMYRSDERKCPSPLTTEVLLYDRLCYLLYSKITELIFNFVPHLCFPSINIGPAVQHRSVYTLLLALSSNCDPRFRERRSQWRASATGACSGPSAPWSEPRGPGLCITGWWRACRDNCASPPSG